MPLAAALWANRSPTSSGNSIFAFIQTFLSSNPTTVGRDRHALFAASDALSESPIKAEIVAGSG
jgi:hypothetical protein